MLRLYVMRHAKSSWAAPGARDFDRELNERGQMDLIKVSNTLLERGYVPEGILCSSAERTRQTLSGISPAIPQATPVTYTEKLYSSGLEDYISLVQSHDGGKSLMIIGHNPMCGSLASSLVSCGNEQLREEISYKYPTGTVSVIEFDTDEWANIAKNKGRLVDCIIPSAL